MKEVEKLREKIRELNLNIIVLKYYFSTIDPDGSELRVARERISKLKEKIREIRRGTIMSKENGKICSEVKNRELVKKIWEYQGPRVTSSFEELVWDLWVFLDTLSLGKKYSQDIKDYFRKIRNEFVTLNSERGCAGEHIGCFGGPTMRARNYFSHLNEVLSYIAKDAPPTIDGYFVKTVLKAFTTYFGSHRFEELSVLVKD